MAIKFAGDFEVKRTPEYVYDFLIDPSKFAALLPQWWLSRMVTGVSIVAPFTLASWWVPVMEHQLEATAVVMYAVGLVWTLATRPLISGISCGRAGFANRGL